MKDFAVHYFDAEGAKVFGVKFGPGWYFLNHETRRAEGPYPTETDALIQGPIDTTRELDES